jgi:hypothetical protein
MRASSCIAAGLFVTNLALLERDAPPPPPPAPAVVNVQAAELTADAQRLAWLWQAKHNGLRVPPCEQLDPLATLDADVHPSPGREHVIGNRRFGVALYAEDGMLIAHHDPVGCVAPRAGDQSLSLSFDQSFVVYTRQLEIDGEHLDAYLLTQENDELVTLIKLDVGGKRIGREVFGKLYVRDGEVEVRYHGRERGPGGWEEVDDHCTWQLATRSSSCRTRAGVRTPESE